MSPSDIDIAWLAGLMDKRGTFFLARTRSGRYTYLYPRIVLRSVDDDLMHRVADVLATKVVRVESIASSQVILNGELAATWMRTLRPWLSGKRQARVDAILTEYDNRPSTPAARRARAQEAAEMRHRDKAAR